MNRSLTLLLSFALLFSCAKEKDAPSSPAAAAASSPAVHPAIATPEEMLPKVPLKKEEDTQPTLVTPHEGKAEEKTDEKVEKDTKEKLETEGDPGAELDPEVAEEPEEKPEDKPAQKPEETKPALPQPKPSLPVLTPEPVSAAEQKAIAIAVKAAQNALLHCPEQGCNPSVGLLSFASEDQTGWGASQCTASLIAPDILVTNGHCVPHDLSTEDSSCAGRIWITFGADSSHPQYDRRIGCDKVIYSFGPGEIDYAYIKLARPSNRPVLRQSRDGFEHGKTYQLHKVNPVPHPGGVAGRFERVNCRSIHNTEIFNEPQDKYSKTQLLTDCQVIPGNSGSPVIAADGTVRAVVSAFMKKDKLLEIYSKNGSSVPTEAELADFNTASNFACLKTPGILDERMFPAICAASNAREREAYRLWNAKRIKALLPGAQQLLRDQGASRPDIAAFDWTLVLSQTDATGIVAAGIPDCVNAPKVQALIDKRTQLRRPTFFVKASYDRYLRASNYAALWGGFSRNIEGLEVKPNGPGYDVKILNMKTSQDIATGLLNACR